MRYPRYKSFNMADALDKLTEPAESYEEVKARMAEERIKDRWQMQEEKYDAQNERPMPFDYQSDYVPESEEK